MCVCVIFLLFFRRQFRKSTTCDISSDEIQSNENNSESSKSTPMSRTRHGGTRRFSLVKLEVTPGDSNSLTPGLNQFFFFISNRLFSTDDLKSSAPSTSPNLIQKLLFRQFSPKTRPYPTAITVSAQQNFIPLIFHSFQSDDNTSSSTVSNDTLK